MAENTFSAVDLSRLPAPDIIEALDFETVLAGRRCADAGSYAWLRKPRQQSRDESAATILLCHPDASSECERRGAHRLAYHATAADLDNMSALFSIMRFTIIPADDKLAIAAIMESDADFRCRMVLTSEGYSVAGPKETHIFYALSAHPDVLDARATSPNLGEVRLPVLSRIGTV